MEVYTLFRRRKGSNQAAPPQVNDLTKDGGERILLEFAHVALTFWWPREYRESGTIVRMKKAANVLNIAFILLLITCAFFFIFMQHINHKYRNVERDWTYVFK